ncbi:MAG: hypothetical protein ACE5I3_10290 [Phycisphaerae bacterium]
MAVSLVGAGSATFAQQRPEALEKLEAYRAALQTGRVEWSIIDQVLDVYAGETRFRTSKFAGNDHILIERGNEEGVVVRTEDGAPSTVGGKRPVYILETGEQFWYRPEDPLQGATVYRQAPEVRDDIRSLGAAAGMARLDIHDLLWRDFAPNPSAWKFEEGHEADLHVVTVQKSAGTRTYWLDPERGWSPVRVRNEHDKYGWSESRSSLTKFDGVWFPEVVEIFSSRYKDGREPEKIIQVYSATFNRREHPQPLTPGDIGMEVGMDVRVRGADMELETFGKWDGEKVASFEEFADRLQKGELTEGPNFTRAVVQAEAKLTQQRLAAARADGHVVAVWTGPMTVEQARKALLLTPSQFESLWEAYTKAFIKTYKLNEEQTQKALSILKSCQQQAHAHVSAHKSDFDRLDHGVKALTKLKGEQRAKAEAEIRRERERLLKPLNDVFEQQLKPRLDKLPTRAQRKAGERKQAPATRPPGKTGGKN